MAERLVDLPGVTLALRVDSAGQAPRLIPNLTTALVLGLSLALAAVVALLVRDVRRRAAAESRLADELALRRAMEDSLVTGLRARDLQGRITYVNPAFCAMVGFSAEQLVGQTVPPYWPPEMRAAYEARHAQRLERGVPAHEQRRLYAARKAKGLVRKEIWAPAELWPALLELIDDVKMRDLK